MEYVKWLTDGVVELAKFYLLIKYMTDISERPRGKRLGLVVVAVFLYAAAAVWLPDFRIECMAIMTFTSSFLIFKSKIIRQLLLTVWSIVTIALFDFIGHSFFSCFISEEIMNNETISSIFMAVFTFAVIGILIIIIKRLFNKMIKINQCHLDKHFVC